MTSIENYENYIIFENGDIINVNTGKKLNPTKDTTGYMRVGLYSNGVKTHFSVHRLIALAYIPNPENKPCIDHINRIRDDNRIENLRWATRLENMQNKGMPKNNTSKTKNVFYDKAHDLWKYEKTVNKIVHQVYFKTENEAIAYKINYELENNILNI